MPRACVYDGDGAAFPRCIKTQHLLPDWSNHKQGSIVTVDRLGREQPARTPTNRSGAAEQSLTRSRYALMMAGRFVCQSVEF